MIEIIDSGLVFDARDRPADQRVAAFVGLSPLADGSAICSFQLGPTKHASTSTVRLCRSTDSGRSWQELPARFDRTVGGVPGSLACGEIIEATPGTLVMLATWFDRSDPDRPVFDPETQGILRSKFLRAFSRDGGQSWSQWNVIPTPQLFGCAGTGPLLRWPDGTIAFPFESYKEYDDPNPARHGAWLLVSTDGGVRFDRCVLVAQHPEDKIYYWDQRLCVDREPGEFVALFWTHDLAQKRDLSVHFRRATITGSEPQTQSMRDTQIPGQIAAPLLLDDGRILAFVVDRDQPGTMTIWESANGGETWPRENATVLYTHDEQARLTQGRTDVDFNLYWEDMARWSFGHPALCKLADGTILAAHYAGTPDCMSVRFYRLKA